MLAYAAKESPVGITPDTCSLTDPSAPVVEDDPDIACVIRLHLENVKYLVCVVSGGRTGYTALDTVLRVPADLVILDFMLPDVHGLDICRQLAERVPRPLILMVTACCSERDRVLGLESGADDYLTGPFGIRELIARVRALLRRRPPLAAAENVADGALDGGRILSVGGLLLDRWERCAELAGARIDLTAREFELLLWFMRNPNRIFSRAELLDAVWGTGYNGFEHTVNSHLNRLRSKLERDASRPALLVTVRGAGYKLVPPQITTPPGQA